MPKAYVMFTIETGYMASVMINLQKMPKISESYALYGVYDIICKLDTKTNDELRENVSIIRNIRGVNATITMIVS